MLIKHFLKFLQRHMQAHLGVKISTGQLRSLGRPVGDYLNITYLIEDSSLLFEMIGMDKMIHSQDA